jgi:hypothetical protein
MIFNPIRQAVETIGLWLIADKMAAVPSAPAADAGHTLRILAVLSAILCAYQLYTATLFFSKKRSAPAAVILGYIAAIVVSLIGAWMLQPITQSVAGAPDNTILMIVRPAAVALVWVPYFAISQRVKRTFVN